MTEEIAKKTEFNPRAMADTLRDKIRLDIAQLMPEEQWRDFLEAAIKDFATETTVPSTWSGGYPSTKASELSILAKEALVVESKKRLAEVLGDSGLEGFWSHNKEVARQEIEKMIKGQGAKIFESMITGSIQHAIENLRFDLGNPT